MFLTVASCYNYIFVFATDVSTQTLHHHMTGKDLDYFFGVDNHLDGRERFFFFLFIFRHGISHIQKQVFNCIF